MPTRHAGPVSGLHGWSACLGGRYRRTALNEMIRVYCFEYKRKRMNNEYGINSCMHSFHCTAVRHVVMDGSSGLGGQSFTPHYQPFTLYLTQLGETSRPRHHGLQVRARLAGCRCCGANSLCYIDTSGLAELWTVSGVTWTSDYDS